MSNVSDTLTAKRRPTGRRSALRQNGHVNFDDLLNRPLPESTVKIGRFELKLKALTSKQLDDMITAHPPEKGTETAFHPDMRFDLISQTVVEPKLETAQVKELLEAWSRPDVGKLQTAVFDLNWLGSGDEQVPLSETESDETGSTP